MRRTSPKYSESALTLSLNWTWNGELENCLIVNKVQGFGEFMENVQDGKKISEKFWRRFKDVMVRLSAED